MPRDDGGFEPSPRARHNDPVVALRFLPLGVSTRRFFYDGGRRIQERLTTPLPLDENGKAISIKDEKDLTGTYTLDYPSYVTREYVWDPDQTDRILAQVVGGGNEYCFIPTDESWTPLGVVMGGDLATSANNGRLVSQSSSDPFGSILNREDLSTLALARRCDVGHQGLFFEPYKDELVAYDGTEDRLSPSNPGLYFNRARWYDAERGRFTTSDPNATGIPVLGSVGWHGAWPMGTRPELSVGSLYQDGMNLQTRVNHAPTLAMDDSGLCLSMSLGVDAGLRSGLGGANGGTSSAAGALAAQALASYGPGALASGTEGLLLAGGAVTGYQAAATIGGALGFGLVLDLISEISGEAAATEVSQEAARTKDDPGQLYRVRLQAQGGGVEKSIPYIGKEPMTAAQGQFALSALGALLSKADLKARADCFARASRYIINIAAGGGIGPSSKSFVAKGSKDVRVDVEVLSGINFAR